MSLPSVAIQTGVASPPAPAQVEHNFLFIGEVDQGQEALQAIGPSTDLAAVFGSGALVDAIGAFRANAGQKWTAAAYGHAARAAALDQAAVVDKGSGKVGLPATEHGLKPGVQVTIAGSTNYDGAYTLEPETTADELVITAAYVIETLPAGATATWTPGWADLAGFLLADALAAMPVPPEGVIFTLPVGTATQLSDLQAALGALLGQHKRMWACVRFRALEAGESWADYTAAFAALVAGASAGRVLIVPTLWGQDLGAYAGAIARKATHQSPIWPGFGPVSGAGSKPSDAGGTPLSLATLETLSAAKASVLMWHEGLAGIYPAQGFPLAGAGEPERIEWLQVADKLARAVRLRALYRLGKGVRDVPADRAAFLQYISQPVRAAAAAGEIQPAQDADFQVAFPTPTSAALAFTWRPLDAAEDISVKLELDAG